MSTDLPVMMPGGPGGAKVPRMGKGASLGFRLGCRRNLSLDMHGEILSLPFTIQQCMQQP